MAGALSGVQACPDRVPGNPGDSRRLTGTPEQVRSWEVGRRRACGNQASTVRCRAFAAASGPAVMDRSDEGGCGRESASRAAPRAPPSPGPSRSGKTSRMESRQIGERAGVDAGAPMSGPSSASPVSPRTCRGPCKPDLDPAGRSDGLDPGTIAEVRTAGASGPRSEPRPASAASSERLPHVPMPGTSPGMTAGGMRACRKPCRGSAPRAPPSPGPSRKREGRR